MGREVAQGRIADLQTGKDRPGFEGKGLVTDETVHWELIV